MIGTVVSRFRIEEELGRGGMGVVYRATDLRLDRPIALKFLSAAITDNPEVIERFEREARTAARTEHPNVCGIYDIGETEDGRHYIAMPFFEGVSLSDRLSAGPLSVAEAVSIARQLASGLASVHVQGIVHRDMKPGNIIITPEGGARILDFGIAMMVDSRTLTVDGSTLGTFAYMSPEQVRGEKLDARTDIWSVGAVLYEMLTGRTPFEADYPEALMYTILNQDPPLLSTLCDECPARLESILVRCLEKDRDSRYSSMAELEADLMEVQAARGADSTRMTHRGPLSRRTPPLTTRTAIAAVILTGLVLAAIAILVRGSGSGITEQPPMRLTMLVPDGHQLAELGPSLAISRDGSRVAFAARDSNDSQLFVRDIDSFDARPVPGTSGASAPFFSPDGSWLGFMADEKVFKVPLAGGNPQKLADAPAIDVFMRGAAAWLDDNRIVFSTFGRDAGLFLVSAQGGQPERLTETLNPGVHFHLWPEHIPDSPYIMYTDVQSGTETRIDVLSLKDQTTRTLIENGIRASFIPPDVLVYAVGSGLFAVRFDPDRLELKGSPVPVLTDVVSAEELYVEYDVSDGGTLVYISQGAEKFEARLTLASRTGALNTLPIPLDDAYTPRSSPDGRYVAFQRRAPRETSLWLHDLHRGATRQLTDDDSQEYWFTWSPDSRHLYYNSNRISGANGSVDIFEISPDYSTEPTLVSDGESHQIPHAVTPDGKTLVYNAIGDGMQLDILALPLEEGGEAGPIVGSAHDDFHPAISPDGRWLAYASSRSGNWEVYVQTFPEAGGLMQVSTGGGAEPLWSPDGSTLYYRTPTGDELLAVDVSEPVITTAERSLQLGKPRLVLSGAFFTCSKWGRSFDLTADGEQFVMVSADWPGAERRRFNVIVNWASELRRLLASG